MDERRRGGEERKKREERNTGRKCDVKEGGQKKERGREEVSLYAKQSQSETASDPEHSYPDVSA